MPRDQLHLDVGERETLSRLVAIGADLDPAALRGARDRAWGQARHHRVRRRTASGLAGLALAAGLLVSLWPGGDAPLVAPPEAQQIRVWPAQDPQEMEDLDQRIAALRDALTEVPPVSSW